MFLTPFIASPYAPTVRGGEHEPARVIRTIARDRNAVIVHGLEPVEERVAVGDVLGPRAQERIRRAERGSTSP